MNTVLLFVGACIAFAMLIAGVAWLAERSGRKSERLEQEKREVKNAEQVANTLANPSDVGSAVEDLRNGKF